MHLLSSVEYIGIGFALPHSVETTLLPLVRCEECCISSNMYFIDSMMPPLTIETSTILSLPAKRTNQKYWHGIPSRSILRWRILYIISSNVYLQQPHSPAIESWDGNFTYETLNATSTRLAEHLKTLGVGANVFVPLCFDKSARIVVAILVC